MKYFLDVKIIGKYYLDQEELEMLNSLSLKQEQVYFDKLKENISKIEFIEDLKDIKVILIPCEEGDAE